MASSPIPDGPFCNISVPSSRAPPPVAIAVSVGPRAWWWPPLAALGETVAPSPRSIVVPSSGTMSRSSPSRPTPAPPVAPPRGPPA